MTGSFRLRIGIISVVRIISVVIGGHFGGGDHFDGGDHFGGGTLHHTGRKGKGDVGPCYNKPIVET